VLVAFSVTPLGVGEGVGEVVAEAVRVVRESGLPVAQVSSTLALMELKGSVRQIAGMQYVVAREARVDYTVE